LRDFEVCSATNYYNRERTYNFSNRGKFILLYTPSCATTTTTQQQQQQQQHSNCNNIIILSFLLLSTSTRIYYILEQTKQVTNSKMSGSIIVERLNQLRDILQSSKEHDTIRPGYSYWLIKHDNWTKTLLNYDTKLENDVMIYVNRPMLLCEQIDVDINTFFKHVSSYPHNRFFNEQMEVFFVRSYKGGAFICVCKKDKDGEYILPKQMPDRIHCAVRMKDRMAEIIRSKLSPNNRKGYIYVENEDDKESNQLSTAKDTRMPDLILSAGR
jgi:hypothetical protein